MLNIFKKSDPRIDQLIVLLNEDIVWADYHFPNSYEEHIKYKEIRKIGQDLYNEGGMKSLDDAAKKVIKLDPNFARLLNAMWDMIGDWRV